MIQLYKRILFSFVLLLGIFSTTNLFAEGSKDLYPSGTTGNRAFLMSYPSGGSLGTNGNASWPYKNHGVHYVYAKNGETIAVASSAQVGNGGSIRYTSPTGTQTTVTTGLIANRTAELAGPLAPSEAANGNKYAPTFITVSAATEGVWKVEFIGAITSIAGTNYTTTAAVVGADASWTQPTTGDSRITIAAWDVSVRNAANTAWVSGRVYTNILNLSIGNSFTNNTQGFYGKVYPLTKDGYAYEVNNNGQIGVFFTFFVNNKGFTTGANGSGNPTYKSLNSTAGINTKDPTAQDNADGITHKIFYNKPDDANLPPDAAINPTDGGTTWLKRAVTVPTVSTVSFEGVENSGSSVSNKGAYIKFNSNINGTYKIVIPGSGNFFDRVLTGPSTVGANTVFWDGKAGTSVADPVTAGNKVPPGTTLNSVKVQLFGAEVHFPYLDVESNPRGIIIRQLTTDGLYNPIANGDVVYWDDTDVVNPANSTPPNPKRAVLGLTPQNSTTNGHIWGTYPGQGLSEYGNEKAIDTYTFVPGPEVTQTIAVTIDAADLEVTSSNTATTTTTSGNEITYTVVIKNLFTAGISVSNVNGAKFGFEHPAGFTVTSAVLTVNNGTIVETSPTNGATKWESTLSMTNGSQGTYVIKGIVGSSLKNTTLSTRSTMLRQADISDPDATSEATQAFSNNVDTECNGAPSGVGCNNIKTNSVTITNNPPVGVPNVSSTNMNTTLTVADGAPGSAGDLLVNDTDADGDVLTVTKFTVAGTAGDQALGGPGFLIPGQGTITINANGSYTFVPVTNFTGAVNTITYTLTDGTATTTSTLNITVNSTTNTLAGKVFNDTNGLLGSPTNTVDGLDYTAANVNVVAWNTTDNKVEAISAVSATGTYNLTVPSGKAYSLYLTTNNYAVGSTVTPVVALPAGWVSTGENIGTTAGNDGTVNSILPIGTINSNQTNLNFGIEQIPTVAGSGSNTVTNPGGTTQVTVPANTFSNITGSSDPTAVTGMRITSFPTNTTSIVVNGVTYNSNVPAEVIALTNLIIPANSSGTPTQTITVDPIAAGTSVISFRAIDEAGKQSTGTGTATLTVNNVITGSVYNDVNGLNGTPANTVSDGAKYTTSGLNAVLVNTTTNVVVAVSPVTAGDYTLSAPSNGDYLVYLTTASPTLNAAPTVTLLPAGYVQTGEFVGVGAGNDGSEDIIIMLPSLTGSISNANFGIEQIPTVAGSGSNTVANPGGTTQVTVPANTFSNITASSDPTAVTGMRITSFPTNTTSIVVNGVTYNSNVPAEVIALTNLIIPANSSGTPTQTITVDPIAAGTSVISFRAIDEAGKQSTGTGTATLTVNNVVTGSVYNDVNGLNGTPANTVSDGAKYTTAGLNAVLVNTTTNVVVAVSPVTAGDYTLSAPSNGDYLVYLTTASPTLNAAPTVTLLPAGYVQTGEFVGVGAGNDGSEDIIIMLPSLTGSISNANFGIEQIPTVAGSGSNTVANPGGTTQVTVPANTFSNITASSDPTAVTGIRITGFPTNTTSIVVNGVTYNSNVPAEVTALTNLIIPANSSGTPTQTITIDPVAAGTSVISFMAIDEAGKQSTGTGTATLNVSNNLPVSNAITGTSQSNPGGTIKLTVPTLTGSDVEDGTYNGTSLTNKIQIRSLATGGTLFYDNIAVTLNQIITNYDPTKLTVDPNNGITNLTFTYSHIDADNGVSTPATVNMPFSNTPPTTNDITNAAIASNTSTPVDISNPIGADVDGTVVSYKIVTLPTTGTLYLANGTTAVTLGQVLTVAQADGLKFQPAGNTNATVTFTLAAIDNNGAEDATPATFTIPLTNTPPATNDITNAAIASNTATPVDISNPTGADVDGTVVSYKIVTLPTSGTLYLANGTTAVTLGQVLTVAQADGLKFQPAGNTNATVTFTLAAIDNNGAEDATPATFTIPLTNTPPTTNDITNAAIASNTSTPVDISNPTGADVDGTVVSYKIVTLPTSGTLYLANGTTAVTLGQVLTVAQADGLKFQPAGNTNATVTFTLAAIDNNGAEDATPATFTIPLTNTPPTTNDITNAAIASNTATPVDISNPTGADVDGTVVSYKIVTLPTSGTLYLANGTTAVTLGQVLTVAQADGLKFQPAGNTNATVTFTLAAIDNNGAEDATPATFTIPLTNTPPTTNDITNAAIASNTATPVDISNPIGADVDGTVVSYKIVTLPTTGTLYLANGTTVVTLGQVLTVAQADGLKFQPAGNTNATVTFTLAAIDNNGAEDATPATFTIPLTNTPPTTNDITNAAIASNTATPVDISNPTGADVDGTVVSYKIVTLPTTGTLFRADGTTAVTLNEILSVADANAFKFRPSGTSNATVTFTLAAIDNNGAEDATPATFTIPLTNTPPTTNDITNAAIASNTATPVDISNPTGADVDGTVVSYKIVTLPTTGTLFRADGTTAVTLNEILSVADANAFKFRPSGTSNATVTFTLAAIDNNGAEDATPATFTIPLTNTPPTTNDITNAAIASNTATPVDISNPTGADVDGTVVSYKIVTLPTTGTLFRADGTTAVTLNEILSVADANAFKFRPSGTSNATVTFTLAAIDNNGAEDATPATFTIPLTNTPPTTNDITNAAIASNTATPVDISNPTGADVDGTVVSYKIVTLPTTGTLFRADGTTAVTLNEILSVADANAFKFRPSGTSNATVTFTLAAIDNNGAEDATPATFTIPLTNTPPTTNDITNAAIASNTSTPVDISNPIGADVDGTVVSYKIVTLPTSGTLYLANGTTAVTLGQILTVAQADGLKFQPAGNTNATVTFTLAAIDNNGAEDATPATFTIPLTNTPPTTNDITNAAIASNTATPVDISNPTGADVDGTVVSYKIVTLPTSGTLYLANGTTAVTLGQVLTVAQADGLKFQPAGNTNATVTFTLAAIDNNGAEDATPATFTIPLTNTPPTTNDITNAAIASNTATPVDISNPTGADVDGTVVSYKIVTLPTNGTLFRADGTTAVTLNEILSVADANAFKFRPSGTSNATVTFTLAAIDNNGAEDATPATFTIPLTNTPPTTNDITNASIASNTATPVDISNPIGADVDGTVVSYKIVTLPTSGTLYLANGTTAVTLGQVLTVAQADGLKFQPAGNTNATVTFTLAAIDNNGAEDATPATFSIPLTNTPPVAVANTITTNEDTPVTLLAIQNNDIDTDGNVVSSTIDLDPLTAGQQLTFTDAKGTWTLTPATGNVLFTPVLNFNGTASINYTINDNDGATSNQASLTVVVNPVNDAPTAAPDLATTLEDVTLVVLPANGLLSNDSDIDGDTPLAVTDYTIAGIIGTQIIGNDVVIPGVGTINIAITGGYRFTPAPNFNGAVPVITYTVNDLKGPNGSATSTLTLTVTPVNDAPSFTKGADQTIAISSVATAQTVTAWATALSKGPADESAQLLDFIVTNDKNSLFTTQPAIDANGNLTYTPAPNQYGKATVSVKIHDNGGTANGGIDESVIQTFVINVKPVGNADTDITPINTPTTTNVIANDGTSGVGTSVILGGTNPTNGTITINPDKSITYTPNNGYVGPDTYTYVLETPDGVKSDPITVSINVYDPKMTLAKDGTYFDFNGNGRVDAGDRINYTFSVRNTGTIALTNISITDANATITGGPIATLSAGAVDNTTFTGFHTLTQAEIDNGGVFNIATATGKDPKNNTVTANSTDPTPLAPTDPSYPVTPPTPACPTCTVTPIVQTGSMTLAKEGTYSDFNANGKVDAGDHINYTFVVTNTGNVTLTNVSISDANATITGGPIATLAAGAVNNTTFTGFHTLTQAEIDNGGVFNIATATGKDPKNNTITANSTDPTPLAPTDPSYPVTPRMPACPTCTVTPIVQTGAMTLAKDGTYNDFNANGKVDAGDRINYTFVVTNTGNVTLTNVSVSDANATIIGGPIATLAAGAVNNTTFTGFHTLTQAEIDNGGVFNVATATGKDPKNNTITANSTDPTPLAPTDPSYPVTPPMPACPTCTVTPIVQTGAMTLAKEGTYNDFNANGKVDAGDRINYTFVVTNTGNVTLTNVSVSDANATIIGGPIATLAAGAVNNTTFTGFHTLTQAEIDNGGVFNVATATGKDPKNNTITANSTDPTPLAPTDPSYPVTPPTPACPTCTVTPIVQTGAMTLAKDGTYNDFNANGKVDAGDRINYTFVVTNTGNVTLTNVSVSDANATIIGGPIATLAAGAVNNTTFTGFHTLTQAEIDNGGVFNVATATGKDPKNNTITANSTDPTPLAPTDPSYPVTPPMPACPTCTVTPIVQTGAMTLAKEGTYNDFNANGKVDAGDRINYTFVVTNTGNVTLKNVIVIDANATITGGPIATLAAGAVDNTTFTGYHTITLADLNNAGVFNVAIVKGTDPKGNEITTPSNDPTPTLPTDPSYPVNPPVTPCPTCTVTPLPQTPSMRILKKGTYADTNGDGVANVGDRINYTFNVINTGNVAITNINITDAYATMVGGPIAILAAGATDNTTFTAYHVLTQTDIENGGVFNVAVGTGKDPRGNDIPPTRSDDPSPILPTDPNYPAAPPVTPCPTCTVTPIVQTPSMRLVKDGTYADTNGDGKVNVGDRINYTFNVINTGNVSIKNISITDANAVVTGGPIANLPAGANDNTTFKAYHILTQSDIDNGGVFNVAIATGKDPKGNDVTTPSNDPSPILPTDPSYPVTPPVTPCPTCTITPIVQEGKLSLLKVGVYVDTNGDGKVNVGDRINYTFVITNTGNVTLTNISVTDPNAVMTGGPIASLAVGAQNTTTFTGYHILTQGDVDNGGVFNLATASAKDPKNKNVTTTSADPTPLAPGSPNYPVTPPTPVCPSCTVTPTIQSPSITLTKDGAYADTNGDGIVNVGDRVNYTFVVTNTGNVTLTNVVITDPNATMLGGPLATLAPGVSNGTTFTGYHILTQADIDNKGVFNLASVTAKDPRGNNIVVNSTDPTPLLPTSPLYPIVAPVPACPSCTVTPIGQTGAIALLKAVTNAGTGAGGAFVLGNSIQYTFTIRNMGNVSLSNITLVDAKLGTGTISVAGTLLPGATTTVVRNYTITAADIAAGNVTNTATVSANVPGGSTVTDVSGSNYTNNTPTVTGLGKPPVATNDSATTLQNNAVVINIQTNDVAGSSPIVVGSVMITVPPLHGTVTVNANGTVTYTPTPGYTGPDTFTYTVKDSNGQTSNPATVAITVAPSAPKAADDNATTTFSKPVIIPIINNDTKDVAPFDLTTIEIVSQPKNGTVKINSDGTITYTPNDGFTGTETFTYRLKDAYGNYTNIAVVNVLVEGLFFGNVITPDGDGKNDVWLIVGSNNYDRIEVEFFNRWGNQVYVNKNYKNDWNGERLNEGTYYYTARLYKGTSFTTAKGWVLVKR